MLLTDPHVLERGAVRLEPLAAAHLDDLTAAVSEPGMERLWYTTVPRPDEVAAEIAARLTEHDAGQMNPWTVLRDGRAVGMTTFCNIDADSPRVEIGHTWLAPSVQRTIVNTTMKWLLLEHAFDTCGVIAVEFRTHWHNRQSRAAIERLGARLDGVLRNHRRTANGALRDTVVYSILPHEWPAVRAGLAARLA